MKAELRDEYADIANRVYREWVNSDIGGTNACTQVALACQELADRPPKELTDAEIERCLLKEHGLGITVTKRDIAAGRLVIAAHIAKQRDPQVVKFRAARCKDGRVEVFRSDCVFTSDLWEWLEPAQEFEVRI